MGETAAKTELAISSHATQRGRTAVSRMRSSVPHWHTSVSAARALLRARRPPNTPCAPAARDGWCSVSIWLRRTQHRRSVRIALSRRRVDLPRCCARSAMGISRDRAMPANGGGSVYTTRCHLAVRCRAAELSPRARRSCRRRRCRRTVALRVACATPAARARLRPRCNGPRRRAGARVRGGRCGFAVPVLLRRGVLTCANYRSNRTSSATRAAVAAIDLSDTVVESNEE